MKQPELRSLLNAVVPLSLRAGEQILEIYSNEFSVDIKEDRSPLTAADLASHHCLLDGVGKLKPEFPIVSEESTETVCYEQRQKWETYWLIDPLDGTKEFIKRNGEFTVNIALIHNHRPILGVVYVPVKYQCYFAAEGVGAFKQYRQDPPTPIRVREKAPDIITVAGSRSHNIGGLSDYLNRLGEHKLIAMGSSLKFCLVAEGLADIYPRIGPTSEWDTAAAHCVVEQAGGQVTDTRGNRLLYNTKDSILNPNFLAFGDSSRDWTSFAD